MDMDRERWYTWCPKYKKHLLLGWVGGKGWEVEGGRGNYASEQGPTIIRHSKHPKAVRVFNKLNCNNVQKSEKVNSSVSFHFIG